MTAQPPERPPGPPPGPPAGRAPAGAADDPPEPQEYLEQRSRALRALMHAERAAAVALLGAVFTLVLFQVVSRYVLAAPLVWTEEVARYALIWLTLVGSGLVMARRRHITARVFSRALGPRGTAVLEIGANLAVMAVAGTLAVLSWQVATALAGVASPAAGASLAWVYGSGVPGFGLVCLHAALNSAVVWRHPETLRDDRALAEGA